MPRRSEVAQALSELVDEFRREGLVIESESEPPVGSLTFPSGRIPFVAPVLNTYTDMQEFMLVDPLHEVDEVAGWPHAKAG
jgi:hypothetical protein